MRGLKNILLLWSLLSPFQSLAWGPIGHKATGFIAEANLTPEAREAVAKILGQTTLAEAVLWPDMVRKNPEYVHTKGYHFANTPESFRGEGSLNAKEVLASPEHKPGVLEAIVAFKKQLAKGMGSKQEKEEALKFLIHCIGDLHQPLHSGFSGDAGGNGVEVKWFDADTNLHQVWDRNIIVSTRGDLFEKDKTKDPGFLYAVAISEEHPSPFKTPDTIGEWYQESLDIMPSTYEGFAGNQNKYLQINQSVLDLRVRKAGLRIAATLNEIFGAQEKNLLINISAEDLKRFFQGLDGVIQIGPLAE